MDFDYEILEADGQVATKSQLNESHTIAPPKELQLPFIEVVLALHRRRDNLLRDLQKIIRDDQANDHQANPLSFTTFTKTFSQQNTLDLLFQLFDYENKQRLQQEVLFSSLREKTGKNGHRFVDLLETVASVINNDEDIHQDQFCRMFRSKGVLLELFHLIYKETGKMTTMEILMGYLSEITFIRKDSALNSEDLKRLESLFRQHMGPNEQLSLSAFKKMLPSKTPFFAERVFHLFDRDGSGGISLSEFMESFQIYCSKSTDDKVRFIFQVYDIDGDGLIQSNELKLVLKELMLENGLKFSEETLDALTEALFEDANPQKTDGITYDQLKVQLEKQPGLLEKLSINVDRWLLPTEKRANNNQELKLEQTVANLKNNWNYYAFLFCFFAVNAGLIISRVIQFRKSNGLYITARLAGQALNFNCTMVLVLMLRRSITFLRFCGWARFLPLDRHVALHVICGTVVMFFGYLHTVMHLINFPTEISVTVISSLLIVLVICIAINIADELEINGETFSAIEWLFTMKPRTFGLIPGFANLSGWVLLGIIIVMSICSLPRVRRSGYFEVFYGAHLLYVPFWIFLILHAPNFWKWFVVPGSLYIIERLVRFIHRRAGRGKTFINSAVLLPSRVTHLAIKRPKNFTFHSGDYVYINIPTIASSEWHPFTISSAPEQSGTIMTIYLIKMIPLMVGFIRVEFIWLHIRGAGGWTNRLYDYFETRQAKLQIKQASNAAVCQRCHTISNARRSAWQIFQGNDPSSKVPARHTCSRPSLLPSNASPQQKTQASYGAISATTIDIENTATLRRRANVSSKKIKSQLIRSYSIARSAPVVVHMRPPIEEEVSTALRNVTTPRETFAPETFKQVLQNQEEQQQPKDDHEDHEEGYGNDPVTAIIDGPYGAPSSNIFHAEHAVLIAAGIGVTPFASILQSIMHRYVASKQSCPRCQYNWSSGLPETIGELKKVDFFWINREQRSFEWFFNLLTQLEIEQAEEEGILDHFLDLHMYITSGLQRTDLKASALHLALDLLYSKEHRDLITGLKTRTKAGRPVWDKIFQQLIDQKKGKITIFYCGPPQLASQLAEKCSQFGFTFSKEVF